MSAKGIIFSAAMVRALLDGRKTQTRRLFKPRGFEFYNHPVSGDRYNQYRPYRDGTWDESRISSSGPMQPFGWGESLYAYLPYSPGDRLYVRENFQLLSFGDYLPTKYRPADVRYAATDPLADCDKGVRGYPWRPCIHMPRWASRLTLTVTNVRVQRLQEISEEDAIAEGIVWQEPTDEDRAWAKGYAEEYGGSADIDGVWIVPGTDCGFGPKPRGQLWGSTAKDAYHALWNSLHTAEGERWEDKPWICAVSFSVHLGNVDEEQEA